MSPYALRRVAVSQSLVPVDVEALGGSLTVDHGRIIGLVAIGVPEAVA
jgi:hypothetical protein